MQRSFPKVYVMDNIILLFFFYLKKSLMQVSKFLNVFNRFSRGRKTDLFHQDSFIPLWILEEQGLIFVTLSLLKPSSIYSFQKSNIWTPTWKYRLLTIIVEICAAVHKHIITVFFFQEQCKFAKKRKIVKALCSHIKIISLPNSRNHLKKKLTTLIRNISHAKLFLLKKFPEKVSST